MIFIDGFHPCGSFLRKNAAKLTHFSLITMCSVEKPVFNH